MIVDSFEGLEASGSTVTTELGAIVRGIADGKDEAGFAAGPAGLRVAAAVFGP